MEGMVIAGTPLSAFRTEIELGLPIYCLPESQVYAIKYTDGTDGIHGLKESWSTFDELLGDTSYPDLVHAPRWSTLDTAGTWKEQ